MGGGGTATCFVYTAVILAQPAGLPKGVRMHAGADWLKLTCQAESGERLTACASRLRQIYLHKYVA